MRKMPETGRQADGDEVALSARMSVSGGHSSPSGWELKLVPGAPSEAITDALMGTGGGAWTSSGPVMTLAQCWSFYPIPALASMSLPKRKKHSNYTAELNMS